MSYLCSNMSQNVRYMMQYVATCHVQYMSQYVATCICLNMLQHVVSMLQYVATCCMSYNVATICGVTITGKVAPKAARRVSQKQATFFRGGGGKKKIQLGSAGCIFQKHEKTISLNLFLCLHITQRIASQAHRKGGGGFFSSSQTTTWCYKSMPRQKGTNGKSGDFAKC